MELSCSNCKQMISSSIRFRKWTWDRMWWKWISKKNRNYSSTSFIDILFYKSISLVLINIHIDYILFVQLILMSLSKIINQFLMSPDPIKVLCFLKSDMKIWWDEPHLMVILYIGDYFLCIYLDYSNIC